LRLYRSLSISNPSPVFELQVLLCVPELNNNQVLVHLSQDSSRVRIEPTPKYILLESWVIIFKQAGDMSSDIAPATMYKHCIPFFRSVYTLLRILPAWKLHRRLRRRGGGAPGGIGAFSIQLRVAGEGMDDLVLGFGKHDS
jgi:autophagy-related protein 13